MVFRKLHGIKPKKMSLYVHRQVTCASYEFDNLLLENSKEEVVSGITIDNKSTFDSHIKSICRKAGQKLGALLRITNYLNSSQKKLTFSGMIKSQLSYCPLIWMFSSRSANNLISRKIIIMKDLFE